MEKCRRAGRGTALPLLKSSWQEWTAIIESFARRTGARRRVDPQDFHNLRERLLTICQQQSVAADEADGLYYHELENLVQPWLDVRVLEHADREILLDVYLRCRKVEDDFGGRNWARFARQHAPKFLFAAAVACVLIVAAALASGMLDPLWRHAKAWWVLTERFAQANIGVPPWILVGAAVTAVFIIVISRLTRH